MRKSFGGIETWRPGIVWALMSIPNIQSLMGGMTAKPKAGEAIARLVKAKLRHRYLLLGLNELMCKRAMDEGR